MENNRKTIWMAIIIIIVLIAFPFFLNWVLQRDAIIPVIGDSSTWLSFWGTFIGALLTALLVLASFFTIQKTVSFNRTRWRIEWLKSFREAAAGMISAVDATEVGLMAQDVNFWRFDQAAQKGHAMELAVKRNSFLMSSVLKEYDVLFDDQQGGKYIDELNDIISPFLQETGEIIQFAIICKFLKEKTDAGQRIEGIKTVCNMAGSMAAAQYHVIEEALHCLKDGDRTDDVVHNAVVKLQQNLALVDVTKLEKLLLRIGSQNAKLTYCDSFNAVSEKSKRTRKGIWTLFRKVKSTP